MSNTPTLTPQQMLNEELSLMRQGYTDDYINSKLPFSTKADLKFTRAMYGIKQGKKNPFKSIHNNSPITSNRWTEEEDKLLKDSQHLSVEALQDILEHRTFEAIRARRKNLGLNDTRDNLWTQAEKQILIDNEYMSASELAKLLPNRSTGAIHSKRNELGLKKHNSHWTKDEINILEENKHLNVKDLSDLLPTRTSRAIQNKINLLGIGKKQNA